MLLFSVLLFSIFSLVFAEKVNCPYSPDVQLIANQITTCLRNSQKLAYFLNCMNLKNSFAGAGNLLNVAPAAQCSEKFNFLLNEIILLKNANQKFLTLNQKRVLNENMPETFDVQNEISLSKFEDAQADFCDNFQNHINLELERNIILHNIKIYDMEFKMYVYRNHDIVSSEILHSHSWEAHLTYNMLKTLEKYQEENNIADRSEINILDVGANIGWYTMVLGLKGYRVFAVEPTLNNIYILRKNLCLYPNIKATLMNIGLGETDKKCLIYSEPFNFGNSETYCNSEPPPRSTKVLRGEIKIEPLNKYADLLPKFTLIKMDIEGYEPYAVKGGNKIFLDQHVPFIQMEFLFRELQYKGTNPYTFIMQFVDNGYEISKESFEGRKLTRNDLLNPRIYPSNLDLFLTYTEEL